MAAVGAETRRASRSNTDLTSVIDLTSPHLVSQLLPGPRRPHPSRLRTDPEDLGRLLVGQAHPVQEHQSLSLTAWYVCQRAADGVAVIDRPERVGFVPAPRPSGRHRQPAQSTAAQVERGTVGVASRIGRTSEAFPALIDTKARLLCQLLCLVGVPGHEVQGSKERLVAIVEEVLEGLGGLSCRRV